MLEALREAEYREKGAQLREQRLARVSEAKEGLRLCLRRRKENIAADADLRAKINRQVRDPKP